MKLTKGNADVAASADSGSEMQKRQPHLTATGTIAQAPALEAPEHHGDRRRFLIWALMIGAVPPERVVERIVAEIEAKS